MNNRVRAVLVLSLFLAASLRAFDQAPTKQLNVVIISVENFDDANYDSALLETNIAAATNSLAKFFLTHFPGTKVTVLRNRKDTTSAHLTEFFRGEFRSLANGNITLLFILSHGEALPSADPRYGSDLRIVASDTPSTDIAGKTIALTTDVIGNVGGLLPGSTMFVFVDTCHAGAAANIGLSIDAAIRGALGVKMMVMASSLSDQLAFRAGFSRALVEMWSNPSPKMVNSQSCTTPEVSPQVIRKRIVDILGPADPLQQGEGYPKVLLHFQGLMCLEEFAADSAIVNLNNATAKSYVANFDDGNGQLVDQPVDAHDIVQVRLYRQSYALNLYQSGSKILTKKIDLTTNPMDWEEIGTPDVAALARGYEMAANAAFSVGVDSPTVLQAKQLAYAAFTFAKDNINAERLANEIRSVHGTGDLWASNLAAISRPTNVILSEVDADNIGATEKTGLLLQRFGQLGISAAVLGKAATAAKSAQSPTKDQLATEAYFTYNAVGDHEAAKRINDDFKLSLNKTCPQCKELQARASSGDPVYSSVLSNIGVAHVFNNLAKKAAVSEVVVTK